MNRGSKAEIVRRTGLLGGFNEAPIHESGKWVGWQNVLTSSVVLQ